MSPLISRNHPLSLRNHKSLRNRVVVPAMASSTASQNGEVTPKTLTHYERLSESGAALIIVEYSYVQLSGRSEPDQLGIDSEDKMRGLSELAKAISSAGAMPGIQLTHAGGKTSREYTGGVLLGASAVAVPVKEIEMPVPRPMSKQEIRHMMDAFVVSSGRAARAGFELVELHSAHGYGLNQWLSPLTNLREDRWGGSLGNRASLLLQTVRRIRHEHPELLISVRMPGQDFIPGGLDQGDMKIVAGWLEKAGVDILSISSGIGGWRRPGGREGEGYLVPEAAVIQKHVGIPVIGVGGIETGKFIDHSLQSGWLRLTAVGRAILRDPVAWKQQYM